MTLQIGQKIEIVCQETDEHDAETIPAVITEVFPNEGYWYDVEPTYTGPSEQCTGELIFHAGQWHLDDEIVEVRPCVQ